MKRLAINRVFVILLLTLFASGAMATASMAHCAGSHSSSAAPSMDGGCDDHKMASGGDASVSMDVFSHHDAGGGDDSSASSDCNDCAGSLCKNQTSLSAHTAPVNALSTLVAFISSDLKLQTVFISKIPDPPRTIS